MPPNVTTAWNRIANSRWRAAFVFLLFLLIPFVVFYWMIPFVGGLIIGNDYPVFSHYQQIEVQYALKTGTFPLYFPGFEIGMPQGALTLGQLYHPIAYVSAWMPGYWNGEALQWNTFLRLITLGLCHFFLYRLWRCLRFEALTAFLLGFLAVYNFRMLDSFRYNASLEAYTGHLLLFVACARYLLRPGPVLLPAAIVGSTYWTVCAGHPQWSYLALIGNVLLVGILVFYIPQLLPEFEGLRSPLIKRAGQVLLYVGVGVVLSSAFTFPFYFDFVRENGVRHEQVYKWTLAYSDNMWGGLSSWLNSYYADVHGAFGGSGLFLLAILFPVFVREGKLPRVVRTLWIVSIVTFLISLGNATPLHKLMYYVWPFFSSFRTPGRINLYLPLLLTLLLGWLLHRNSRSADALRTELAPGRLLAYGLIIYALYNVSLFWFGDSASRHAPMKLHQISPFAQVAAILLGGITIASFGLSILDGPLRRKAALQWVGVIAIFLHTILLLRFGTWTDPNLKSPTLAAYAQSRSESIVFGYPPGYGMVSKDIVEYFRNVPRDRWEKRLAWIAYTTRRVGSPSEAFAWMKSDSYETNCVALECSGECGSPVPASGRVRLAYNSWNRFVFEVATTERGVLVVNLPVAKQWTVTMDGAVVPGMRADGLQQGIAVPAGKHRIEFRYFSGAAATGVAVTLGTLALFGAYLVSRTDFGRALRGALMVLWVAGCLGLAVLWQHSLYSGSNLGTIYEWKHDAKPGAG